MMDRGWMSKPRSTTAYKDGVEQFLSFAFRDVPLGDKILCPCVNCGNKATQNYDEVKTHLRCDGILQGYTKWVCHGEEYDSPSFAFADMSNNNSSFHIPGFPMNSDVEGSNRRLHDIPGLLSAIFPMADGFESLSSSDGELDGVQSEFENLEPGLAENVNTTCADDDTMREQDTYTSFLEEASTDLYPGCAAYSRLSFLVTLYHKKVLHRWSQESFTDLFGVLSVAFPHINLPKKYYEVKKIIRGLGLDYEKIHACPKDCMLFRGERANQESCHVCGSSRWIINEKKDSASESRKKKKPAKVLRYFPLIPRLQRLFATKKTSNDMRWHDKGRTKDGLLRHPADGTAWKDLDDRYPKFAEDARNVRLGLGADGFNPFRLMSAKHSTWPVMLIPYNLPPWICMKQTSLILSMIIPGPSSPGNDIDVYLQPLVDELLQLWKGVDTFDSCSQKKFPLRAALLWTLNDFPALAYLYGWSTSGKYACPSCGAFTRSYWLKKSKKFCYMGHRRWLPQGHVSWRRKKEFDNTEEMEPAPITMSGSSALRMLQGRVFVLGKKAVVAKKGKGKQKSKASEKETEGHEKQKRKRATPNQKKSGNVACKPEKKPEDCLKKKSIFFDLEYWEQNKLRHNLDVMHIEKNVCENLVGTLLDIDSKTKDGLNARLDLEQIGIRSNLQPGEDSKGKPELPHAPFTMNREKKEILCTVIKNSRTPYGYASNFSRCVNMKECALTGLKSHDCHVILEDILPVALLHCYPSKDVMIIVVELANFFKKLCSKVLDISELDKLQESIVKTLCNMEKFFLPSFFTIMVHLMVHLVEEAKLGGPVHYRWMYPLERSFVWLKSLVRNRAYPEGSIAEGYVDEECMTFCSIFLEGTTHFTRTSRNPDPSDNIKGMYMFDSAGEPIGKAIAVGQLDDQLRHCDELDDLRREFVDQEKGKPCNLNLTEDELIRRHFADWLEQKLDLQAPFSPRFV